MLKFHDGFLVFLSVKIFCCPRVKSFVAFFIFLFFYHEDWSQGFILDCQDIQTG